MLTIIILGIDFLTRLLTIDPAKRMTVGEFLSFFFAPLHVTPLTYVSIIV